MTIGIELETTSVTMIVIIETKMTLTIRGMMTNTKSAILTTRAIAITTVVIVAAIAATLVVAMAVVAENNAIHRFLTFMGEIISSCLNLIVKPLV
jgi:hypothetical protein